MNETLDLNQLETFWLRSTEIRYIFPQPLAPSTLALPSNLFYFTVIVIVLFISPSRPDVPPGVYGRVSETEPSTDVKATPAPINLTSFSVPLHWFFEF